MYVGSNTYGTTLYAFGVVFLALLRAEWHKLNICDTKYAPIQIVILISNVHSDLSEVLRCNGITNLF